MPSRQEDMFEFRTGNTVLSAQDNTLVIFNLVWRSSHTWLAKYAFTITIGWRPSLLAPSTEWRILLLFTLMAALIITFTGVYMAPSISVCAVLLQHRATFSLILLFRTHNNTTRFACGRPLSGLGPF